MSPLWPNYTTEVRKQRLSNLCRVTVLRCQSQLTFEPVLRITMASRFLYDQVKFKISVAESSRAYPESLLLLLCQPQQEHLSSYVPYQAAIPVMVLAQ